MPTSRTSAHEFANSVVATMSHQGRMHPGTVIAATARMGGTYLFRSFGLHLPGVEPGQPVLSLAADEEVPILIQITADVLAKVGIAIDNTHAGKPTDPMHLPTDPFPETQRKLEPVCAPI